MDYEGVIERLESQADTESAGGMARFGIRSGKVYGIRIPVLRKLAKEIGTDHALAERLWLEGSREARILAAMTADPLKTTECLLERWVADLDNWEVCDQCCFNLFDKTPFAVRKCFEWSGRKEPYVKRAGFALMARLAWTAKDLTNNQLELFFRPITEQATDGRPEVKKAVNWALRQLGKRNAVLNRAAIAIAEEIAKIDNSAAKWIASDALRELRSERVQSRFDDLTG